MSNKNINRAQPTPTSNAGDLPDWLNVEYPVTAEKAMDRMGTCKAPYMGYAHDWMIVRNTLEERATAEADLAKARDKASELQAENARLREALWGWVNGWHIQNGITPPRAGHSFYEAWVDTKNILRPDAALNSKMGE